MLEVCRKALTGRECRQELPLWTTGPCAKLLTVHVLEIAWLIFTTSRIHLWIFAPKKIRWTFRWDLCTHVHQLMTGVIKCAAYKWQRVGWLYQRDRAFEMAQQVKALLAWWFEHHPRAYTKVAETQDYLVVLWSHTCTMLTLNILHTCMIIINTNFKI